MRPEGALRFVGEVLFLGSSGAKGEDGAILGSSTVTQQIVRMDGGGGD